MRKGRRQKLKSGDEHDVVGAWKQLYKYLAKSKVKKKIKKILNKRARQERKNDKEEY